MLFLFYKNKRQTLRLPFVLVTPAGLEPALPP